MDGMKDALLRLVRAWTRTNTVLDAYIKANLDSNLLFQICGEIEESISILVGEADEDLENTVTNLALTAPVLTEERRVKMLMDKYEETHPALPAPHLFSKKDMRESVRKNGGYLCETPEGGWT